MAKLEMDKTDKNKDLLVTWKEIAKYLDCDVKTCLSWEKKFRLPVHRLGEKSGSRVYAYKRELDKWLAGEPKKKPTSKREFHLKPQYKTIIYLFVPILVITVFYLVYTRIGPDAIPSDFSIENNMLNILNKNGKTLWSHSTKVDNLLGEEHYKKFFNHRQRIDMTVYLPNLLIKDVNKDSYPEVLFTPKTQDESGEGKILCFNFKGNKLWEFDTGQKTRFGNKTLTNDFRVRGFISSDLDSDGLHEIILVSMHKYECATQLVVLDSDGQLKGEYWNAGHFGDIEFLDINNDGRKEIIAVGLNNEYQKGCLVVFDYSLIKGASPQKSSGEFKFSTSDEGTQKYYILFPRTDVDLLEYKYEAISYIDILKNQRFLVRANLSKILYEFDYDLILRRLQISHYFENKHDKALGEGKISSIINNEYKNNIEKGILYYDGEDWVSKPTMNIIWR